MMLCGNQALRSPTGSSSDMPYDEQRSKVQHPTTSTATTGSSSANNTLAMTKAQRQAAARKAAAKSKSKLWGPSHSFDSDDDDDSSIDLLNPTTGSSSNKYSSNLGVQGGFGCGGGNNVNINSNSSSSWWDTMNKAWTEINNTAVMVHQVVRHPTTTKSSSTANGSSRGRRSNNNNASQLPLQGIKEEVEELEDSDTDPSTQEDSNDHSPVGQHHANNNNTRSTQSNTRSSHTHHTTTSTSRNESTRDAAASSSQSHAARHSLANSSSNTTTNDPAAKTTPSSKVEAWTDMIFSANACVGSPCSAQDLEDIFGRQQEQQEQEQSCTNQATKTINACGLGIAPLAFDCGDDDDDHVAVAKSKQQTRQTQYQQRSTSTTTATSQPPLPKPVLPRTQSDEDSKTPAERRRQRNQVRRQRHEQAVIQTNLSNASFSTMAPHEDFEVTSQQDVLITQPSTTAVLQQQSQLPPPLDTVHDNDADDEEGDRGTVLHFPQQPPVPQPPLPMETLLVKEEEAQALERSISELTMRSSYQPPATTSTAHAPPEQRRMAYYAVGRHHRLNSGPRSGGNRRCYFTGKLIFGGAPFYAGIVQQGLRTLVVFCLPSALGMPQNLPGFNTASAHNTSTGSSASRRFSLLSSKNDASSVRSGLLQRSRRTLSSAASINTRNTINTRKSLASTLLSKSPSRLSSTIHLDDMSLSIEGDIDPNWNLDKDYLLGMLPEPSAELLGEMNQRYPEQFETLPVQVRHAKCWRLYMKFCFFSGLPIAEGELHYQVHPALALELYGEDIVLSHDVMEAVNGASSADILKLPNQKTFRYLKKNYQQQSAKLPEVVFTRTSWEQVKPEV